MARRELSLRPAGAFPATLGATGACLALYFLGYGPFGVLAATLFGTLVLSCVATMLAARHLSVAATEATHGIAGAEFLVPVRIENRGRFSARDVWVEWTVASQRGRRALAARLGPRSTADLFVPTRIAERGSRRALPYRVHTTFPLGLFRIERRGDLDIDLVVWPRPGPLRGLDSILNPAAGRVAPARRSQSGEGEFFAMREWREGESLRDVHWKHSVRRGRRLVREVRAHDRPTVRLVLSTRADWNALGGRLARRPAGFERAVGLTASLAQHLLDNGHRVRFELHAPQPARVRLDRGRPALISILNLLADVEASPGWSAPEPRPSRRDGALVVLVTAVGGAVPERPGRVVLDASSTHVDALFRPTRARGGAAEVAV